MKKNIFYITLMFGVISFIGCSVDNDPNNSYTHLTANQFNELKSPVRLFSKIKDFGAYSVSVIDSGNDVYFFGNMSSFANMIGDNYEIGDTLK